MEPRTLVELGWPELTRALASRCRLPGGRERSLALPFLGGPDEVRAELARVEEARRLAEAHAALPLGGAGAAEEALQRARKGGVLEPLALRECAGLARAAARTRAFLEARAGEVPLLAALAGPLGGDERLADRIEAAVEPSGAVSDRASPALAGLRDRVRGLHRALKAQVEGLLADEGMARNLRDRYFTIRNDRYVIPVLAGARAAVPGIVHNASQSGQTLFVEPEGVVETGNELSIASAMAAEEEQRVLRELSEAVARGAGDLLRDAGLLADLDRIEAAARLASDLDAHAPEVTGPGEGFELLSLRHPLLALQGKKVVASHVRLLPPARALVVSGPNGGGKTVAITAVGLSALMLRAGLPVAAAAGSRLPCYGDVRAAVDERGDLARDLSTFTAHLTAVRAILEASGPSTLALVDEIAADTDPREGAALAAALLEALGAAGATVLVTTHLDELKALALSDPRYANARVGFDAERMLPTFQLHLGQPGSSSALEVARRVGLPGPLVDRAREALSGGGSLAGALRALEEERARLEAGRGAAAAERERSLAALERARAREEAARRAEREAAARLGERLAEEVEAARAEVAELLARLQAAPTVKEATAAARQLDEWRDTVARAARAAGAQATALPEAAPGEALRRGSRVRLVSLGQEGEVLELAGEEALVRVGGLKVRRPVADLLPLRGPPAPAPGFGRSREEKIAAAADQRPGGLPVAERKLDARGLRVEELLREVDRFLDRLLVEGAADGVILHGHGTGALKHALREHLEASPHVGGFRAGDRREGGDAVTVVALRR